VYAVTSAEQYEAERLCSCLSRRTATSRTAFVYKLVHNLERRDDLQIYSYGAVARSPQKLTRSEGPRREVLGCC